MLTVLLAILKGILMVLLCVLGVLLALVLLVLLVPVRYRGQGSYHGELKAKLTVSWLLFLVALQVVYDGQPDLCVRILGIRVGKRAKAGETVEEEETAKTGEMQTEEETAKTGEMKTEEETAKPGEMQTEPERAKTGETEPEENTAGTGETETEEGRTPAADSPGRRPHLPNPKEKIRMAFQDFCGKLKVVREKKEQALAFVSSEENKKTFHLLKKQIFALLRHIFPKSLKGNIRFGFDDPYTTGQILMYAAPFYGWYAKHLQLIPVFEEKTLEGELAFRGRIRVGTLLVIGIRVLFDKNFRKLLRKWRQV